MQILAKKKGLMKAQSEVGGSETVSADTQSTSLPLLCEVESAGGDYSTEVCRIIPSLTANVLAAAVSMKSLPVRSLFIMDAHR